MYNKIPKVFLVYLILSAELHKSKGTKLLRRWKILKNAFAPLLQIKFSSYIYASIYFDLRRKDSKASHSRWMQYYLAYLYFVFLYFCSASLKLYRLILNSAMNKWITNICISIRKAFLLSNFSFLIFKNFQIKYLKLYKILSSFTKEVWLKILLNHKRFLSYWKKSGICEGGIKLVILLE